MTKEEFLRMDVTNNEDWATQQFLLRDNAELKSFRSTFRTLISKTLFKSWAHDGLSVDDIHCVILRLLGDLRFFGVDRKEMRDFRDQMKQIPKSNEEWAAQQFFYLHRKNTLERFEREFNTLTEIILFKSWASDMTLLAVSRALDKALEFSRSKSSLLSQPS